MLNKTPLCSVPAAKQRTTTTEEVCCIFEEDEEKKKERRKEGKKQAHSQMFTAYTYNTKHALTRTT